MEEQKKRNQRYKAAEGYRQHVCGEERTAQAETQRPLQCLAYKCSSRCRAAMQRLPSRRRDPPIVALLCSVLRFLPSVDQPPTCNGTLQALPGTFRSVPTCIICVHTHTHTHIYTRRFIRSNKGLIINITILVSLFFETLQTGSMRRTRYKLV